MVDTADQARAIVDAVRYGCPADHEKRLIVAMIETPKAIEDIDHLLAVDGVDVFFIGPGDLSQNMGFPPAPPYGQPRPQAVIERVGFAVSRIRAAGKVAGTLVTSDELPFWLERGVLYFYIHSDPFLRVGLAGVRKMLGR
jgi:4-hydroxy-2-oxoheptanedioate aldolase